MRSETTYSWVLFDLLRCSQDFVHRARVDHFIKTYANGEWIHPPTAYEHPKNMYTVVQDGHNRAYALFELSRLGYNSIGMGGQDLSIDSGMPVKLFTLPFYRAPHAYLYELEMLNVKELEKSTKGRSTKSSF